MPSPFAITLEDIHAAHAAIASAVPPSPQHLSRTLSAITGAEVTVKFENLQFTASFKERGALNRLLALDDDARTRGVIAMSAGNHAQGVAYHAQRLGIPAVIVMPSSTPFVKIRQTEAFGARVVLAGETVLDCQPTTEEIRVKEGLTFIHPYDDPLVMAGQGTVAIEMLEESPDLEILMAPIGGGGLLSGMAIAAKGLRPDIRLYGVEASRYPSAHNRLKGLGPVRGGPTVAEGIAVKEPGTLTLPVIEALVDDILLVDEPVIEDAINLYATIEKTVAEGAGAAPLAALLAHKAVFAGRKVGIVLCGGNIDARIMASVMMRSLVREGRMASLAIEVNDVPGQLARVAGIIGAQGGNIVEVQHQRLMADMSVKSADLDVTVETRDHAHLTRIIEALTEAGFPARRKS